jgi:truncated hemoglobin YjbI
MIDIDLAKMTMMMMPHPNNDDNNIIISAETIAAIFGVLHPEWMQLSRQGHEQEEQHFVWSSEQQKRVWKLEPNQHYQVHVLHHDNHPNDNDDDKSIEEKEIVPIHGIFALFPGETDDEKSDRIHQLSETFYDKIWNDPETPKEFRDLFVSRSSSASIQAFRQYDWFHEVFGGPSMMMSSKSTTAPPRRDILLRPKVMAKHTKSRMTREHAMTWLHIMKRSVQDEFPNHTKLQSSLGLYWLHFLGLFPYTDDDRIEFRRIVFGTTDEAS